MNNNEIINNLFDESAHFILDSKKLTNQLSKIIEIIIGAYKTGNKVIIFGNGGSAADSQHFAAELIGRYKKERQSLPAIALTTDSSIITALGNDYGFEYVFSRQCESIVQKNDIVFAISTSGNSPNVINGIIKITERITGIHYIQFSNKKALSISDQGFLYNSEWIVCAI